MATHTNLEDKNSFDDIPMVDLPEHLSTGTTNNSKNHESSTQQQPSQFHHPVGSPSLSSINSTLAPSSPPRTPPTTVLQHHPRLPPTLHLHSTATSSPTATSSSSGSPHRRGVGIGNGTPQMMVLGKDGSDYRDMLLLKTTTGDDTTRNNNSNDKKQALLDSSDQPKDTTGVKETPSIFHKTPTTTTNTTTTHGRRHDTFDDEHSEKPVASKVSQWWGSLWTKDNNNDNNNNNSSTDGGDYATMEPPPSPRVANRLTVMDDDVEEGATVYMQPQQLHRKRPRPTNTTTTTSSLHQSVLRKLPLPITKEDQIQQDCSFLYRSVEEDHSGVHHQQQQQQQHATTSSRSRSSLRAVKIPPLASRRYGDTTTSTTTTLYSRDLVDVLSNGDVSQFQTKYHQLNRTLEPVYTQDRYDSYDQQTDDYNDYAVLPATCTAPTDLTLEEQQHPSSARPPTIGRHGRQHSYVTDVTSQSSMFYQVNGRVLLRLPRDSVRLMVADPAVVEAGVLSVVQTRPATAAPEEGADLAHHTKNLPRLEYCLTVPPNLYQQVVSDMQQCATRNNNNNNNNSRGGGGIDLHFYASEHADIKIAIGIMAVIMFILGINTLVFDLS